MDLYREPYIISEIRKWRLWWLGHANRMPEEKLCLKISQNEKGHFQSQERNGSTLEKKS
jgi:hypothetical protein